MKENLTDKNNRNIIQAARTGLDKELVAETVDRYLDFYNEEKSGMLEKRSPKFTEIVNHYFDLVTEFYQYGWGDSFHFAPRAKGESFGSSIKRHQLFLAHQMNLQPREKVLDVGCGVGGPMRTIVLETGSQITGINNNAYQIDKARLSIDKAGLESLCNCVKGDFMNMPFENATFDAAYQIEATPHAPDKTQAYSEIFRVLKPGGVFSGYEWCLTDLYDSSNSYHRELKKQIEKTNGLLDLPLMLEINNALINAGFEILEARDMAPTSDLKTPWYLPLTNQELGLRGFARSRLGRVVTNFTVRLFEQLRIVPHGATEVSNMLNLAADALVAGGKLGIFTPMYFHLAKKI